MIGINEERNVNWMSAIVAGLLATVVITITLSFSGTNIMKGLGGMILGASAGATAQYIVGGLMHLVIGVSYAVIFAVLFAPVSAWSTVTKGAVFGIAVTALALSMMPVMAAVMGGDAAANPCNPCGGGGSPYAALTSLANHVVYGLAVAFVYKGAKTSTSS